MEKMHSVDQPCSCTNLIWPEASKSGFSYPLFKTNSTKKTQKQEKPCRASSFLYSKDISLYSFNRREDCNHAEEISPSSEWNSSRISEAPRSQPSTILLFYDYGVCGCPNVFAAVLVYGMLATIFMIVFICFSASSNHKYDRDKDPFSSKNFYRRKVKEEIGHYQPRQREEHLEEIHRRLTDLRDDFRNIKDLKIKYHTHCHTCSLVTSSGRLLFHQAGPEIDKADCVIRMNNAPVVGYEEYVGKRTTTRVVCFRSVGNLRKTMLVGKGQTDEVVVWGAENPGHGRWAMSKLKLLLRQYPRTRWYSLKDVGEEKVNLIFESETGISRAKSHTWLSTGLFTILLALQSCDNVTVYGMVDENYCKVHSEIESPYHYWEDLPWNECEFLNMHENEKKQGHRYLTEKALYRRFASMFNLQFRYPEWNLTQTTPADINSPFRDKYLRDHPER